MHPLFLGSIVLVSALTGSGLQGRLPVAPATRADSPLLLAQNRYEAELLALINAERRKAGLPALRLSPQLSQAAQRHAEDMVRNNFFDHTGSNGSQPSGRARAAGYSSSYLGENIAAGHASPAQTVRQWMNSPGHRANILKPEYAETGFGYVAAPSNRYRYVWVQVFGRPQNQRG